MKTVWMLGCWEQRNKDRKRETNKCSKGKVTAQLLPNGHAVPNGKEMKIKEKEKSQPSPLDIKVFVHPIVRVLLWVCLSCIPRPADSMLQSLPLFTFWTQLTLLSLCLSFLPSPSLHFPISFPVSFSLGFSLSYSSWGSSYNPALQRSSTGSGFPNKIKLSSPH